MSTVLVLGDYRQSLTLVRSLAGKGERLVAAVPVPRVSYLARSRRVSELWLDPPPVTSPEFDEAVADAIARYGVDVIFPVGDVELKWMVSARHDLDVTFAAAAPDVVELCQDKPQLLAVADRLGVPVTPSRVVSGLVEIRAFAAETGFPLFLKSNDPTQRLLGTKGLVCRTPADLIDEWPKGHDSLIVQQYVTGPRHNLYFAAAHGQLRGEVQVKITRTDTTDGTGYAVEGVSVEPMAEVVEATRRLVAELDYHGVGCTQFLVDEGGRISFLELNPRLGANYAIADKAGLDLAGFAVGLTREDPLSDRTEYRSGLRYVWTVGDIEGLKVALRNRKVSRRGAVRWLGRTLWAAANAHVHVTWRLSDPRPALSALWRSLGAPVIRRLGRRRPAPTGTEEQTSASARRRAA